MRRVLLVLLCVVCLPSFLLGESATDGNALAIFNAFLARYAGENLIWRAEIKMRSHDDKPPPLGYLIGKSTLGEYSYRPMLFTELSRADKRAMLRDPRLGAFIATLRQAADGPDGDGAAKVEQLDVSQTAKLAVRAILDALPAGQRNPRDVVHVVEISAQQMLNDGPITIYLP